MSLNNCGPGPSGQTARFVGRGRRQEPPAAPWGNTGAAMAPKMTRNDDGRSAARIAPSGRPLRGGGGPFGGGGGGPFGGGAPPDLDRLIAQCKTTFAPCWRRFVGGKGAARFLADSATNVASCCCLLAIVLVLGRQRHL